MKISRKPNQHYRNPGVKRQQIETPIKMAGVQAEKDWTVLYLMDGTNDLEPYIMQNMRDLEKVGSGKNVNVVAQMSRGDHRSIYGKHRRTTKIDGDWMGTRRYYVTKAPVGARKLHSPVLSHDVDVPNHGAPSTIADFLSWGMKKFPAKHYMVVVSDHGKGFVGTGFDRFSKDHLKLGELRQGLEQAVQQTGIKPDMLVFDACEMASLEVAHELKDVAKTLVASEEVLGAEGLPHIKFLRNLSKTSKEDGLNQAANLVEFSRVDQAQRFDEDRPDAAVQLSAIDLSKVEQLTDAVTALGKAMGRSKQDPAKIKTLVESTLHFCEKRRSTPDSDYRDLGHFCQNLVESSHTTGPVKKAAERVLTQMQTTIIASQNEAESMSNATGISVYIPNSPVPERFNRRRSWGKFDDSYHDTNFDKDSQWSQWINTYFGQK